MAFFDGFPIFHTTDLARAAAFYRDRLGFEERYRTPEEGPPIFVALTLGEFSLGFAESSEVDPAGRVALWFYTDDVDAQVETLRKAGVEVLREPADQEWGERMAVVADPDGNEVCLGQRLEGGSRPSS